MKKEGNITTTVCCVNAVTVGMADGDIVALFFCGWCEDKHVKVKQ
jgi:hypothetical protein